MTNDFIGFDFLPSSMHLAGDIRLGYVAQPAAMPDTGMTGKADVAGAAMTVDATAGHGVILNQHALTLNF